MWVRESWRSISRSQDGSESPTQCVLYSTAIRDDSASPLGRLVTGDLNFESLKGSRNVVLSDVVRRGVVGKIVEHILGQSRR